MEHEAAADPATRRAWLEIDLAALRRNAEIAAAHIGGARLLPMVKADGYGLGALRVARALRGLDVWGLGVATAEEGAELRRAGVDGRIVVFSPCAPLDAAAMLEHGLEPVVSSAEALSEYARAAGAADATLPVHLEIDTGMGRSGLVHGSPDVWMPRLAAELAAGHVRLASTFTHFHSSERDPTATRIQWERYQRALGALGAAEIDPGARHAANGGAMLRYPQWHADVVRPGLFLYGGGRGAVSVESPGASGEADPVVRVRARVLDVREVPAGTTVSYGATYTTDRPSRLATLGIGYGDGLPHALSGGGEAIVAGRRVPVRGAVCMDVTVVDVTAVDGVRPGFAATLLGRDGDEEIRLDELAARCGTIEYEILTGLGRRLPRVESAGPPGVPRGDTLETGGSARPWMS
ncbi:MAG: alanine racemase [Gemmatimonadota bacterium]